MIGAAGSGTESEEGLRRRPGSGLWSVLGWLRGAERASSCDSLSSAGSARTAVSFAFVAPPPPRTHQTSPLPPPTDSCRRRLHDSDLRRQRDRDLTLHRKYGLYYGYDAFSLPHGPKNTSDFSKNLRDRRAASESFPRRTAYVPGKRRAPLPPARPHSIASTESLYFVRRRSRKRPAPPPPTISNTREKENKGYQNKNERRLEMNNESENERRRPLTNGDNTDLKSDKTSPKLANAKGSKLRSEKSFLKQIFESKKRNSPIEPADRILPNISELDRRAAEIIESCKLKPLEQNNNNTTMPSGEAWFCTRCLRKYDSTVVTCQYCLPEQKRLSGFGFKGDNSTQTEKPEALSWSSGTRVSGVGSEEKKKLKEMLKEMKDSLPKRPKHERNKGSSPKMIYKFDSTGRNTSSFETETLRIGASAFIENDDINSMPSTSKTNVSDVAKIEKVLPKIKSELSKPLMQNVVITEHVVLVGPQPKTHKLEIKSSDSGESKFFKASSNLLINKDDEIAVSPSSSGEAEKNLQTPLKISSLLNPVYVPKANITENQARKKFFLTKTEPQSVSKQQSLNLLVDNSRKTLASEATNIKDVKINSKLSELPPEEEKLKLLKVTPTVSAATNNTKSVTVNDTKANNIENLNINQYLRRRDIINRLEQSIAKGDEKAAAEAAVQLAQLRLSCSVLSFTSQILAGTSGAKSSNETSSRVNEIVQTKKGTENPNKVNVSVQVPTAATSHKNAESKALKINMRKESDLMNTSSSIANHKTLTGNNVQDEQTPSTSNQPSTSKQIDDNNGPNETMIQVWVEDREATRGPLRLRISRRALMADLRAQAEMSLGLPGALQRWIVGRALCTDDRTLAGPDLSAPFYLCVVEAENAVSKSKIEQTKNDTQDVQNQNPPSEVYSELMQLEQQAVVVNAEPFECGVCMEECAVGRGTILRECVHTFCRECLSDLVRHSEEAVVACPAMGCPGVLQEREIRALVSREEYERWLARGLAAAETGTRNAFHCRTRDCTGWAFCDPEVRRFPCPVCKHTNCIPCQAIHEGETCEEHLRKLEDAADRATAGGTGPADEGTQALLDTLIRKGEALECPECSAIITKKWGCDWIKCSACKTEICWVTRGRRWGPAGKGDTSGGCRCGVDGKRCHPSCGYCH